MHRVALAPCSPFSVSEDLLRESAVLARSYGVRLHTHLAETRDEENFTLSRFGMRPLEYMDSLGWLQYRQGKLNEALQTLRRAFQLKGDPEIAAHLGEVLWQLGQQDEARAVWQNALKRSPGNATLQATVRKFQP